MTTRGLFSLTLSQTASSHCTAALIGREQREVDDGGMIDRWMDVKVCGR